MSEPLVVESLKEKRAEIHGRIAAYQAQIAQAKHDLAHINASIRLFTDPEYQRARYIVSHGFFKKGDVGGFSGPIVTQTGGAIMINLYTNPQQDVSIGVRHIPMAVPVMGEMARYRDVGHFPHSIAVWKDWYSTVIDWLNRTMPPE